MRLALRVQRQKIRVNVVREAKPKLYVRAPRRSECAMRASSSNYEASQLRASQPKHSRWAAMRLRFPLRVSRSSSGRAAQADCVLFLARNSKCRASSGAAVNSLVTSRASNPLRATTTTTTITTTSPAVEATSSPSTSKSSMSVNHLKDIRLERHQKSMPPIHSPTLSWRLLRVVQPGPQARLPALHCLCHSAGQRPHAPAMRIAESRLMPSRFIL